MAQQNEAGGIVCRRCGASEMKYESAYDAIRNGWRLRRVGNSLAKDYLWLCVTCAESERPPAITDPLSPRGGTRRWS